MPELETVIIAYGELLKPGQKHKKIVAWYNVPPSDTFISDTFKKAIGNDIFGIVSSPYRFTDENSLSVILKIFNSDSNKVAMVQAEESNASSPILFINMRLIPKQGFNLKNFGSFCQEKGYSTFKVAGLFRK